MKNKHPWARIQIIDRELSKHDYVKTKDLEKIIQRETLPVTLRTIQKDIEQMKELSPIGYAAPIAYDSKRKAYFYKDPDFTIQAFGLKTEDVMALLFYARTLEQYKGFKIFSDISRAIEKVLDNFNIARRTKELIADRTLLQTEKVPIIKGIEFIEPIIKAILEKQKITFNYRKFEDSNINKRTLAPILLKEDKHYWYVIGIMDGKHSPITFALDRMSNLRVTNNYFSPPAFNVADYFKYSFGITVPEKEPVEIVLSFTPFQGNYIKALPIHETQKIVRDNKKELRISIKVKPSYEFYSKILGYGEDVKVISPQKIVKEVKKQIREAHQRYN